MMVFYIIGVVVSLLFYTTVFAWEIANDYIYIYEIDIPSRMKGIVLVSLSSWLSLFFVVMVILFTEKE